MMKSRRMKIIMIINAIVIAFALAVGPYKAGSAAGICGDAEAKGVCVGSGAKCTLKKGIFSIECGKDPEGPAIEIVL